MDKIVYNLVYNRKGSLNKKGTALVQIEAYQGKRKKYFSTKVYLKPEQWDNKKLIVKNHPNSEALNWWLHECVAHIEKVELELWQQGRQISLELIKGVLRKKEDLQSFIYEYGAASVIGHFTNITAMNSKVENYQYLRFPIYWNITFAE